MGIDPCLATLVHRDWLTSSLLVEAMPAYIAALRELRYGERTIRAYAGVLAHFSHWMQAESIAWTRPIAAATIDRFLHRHLPVCGCPAPRYAAVASAGAAVRHLVKQEESEHLPVPAADPIAAELQRFAAYLAQTGGFAACTCHKRVCHLGGFLTPQDVAPGPVLPRLTVVRLDAFLEAECRHLRPVSIRDICTSLRSYFRYRTVWGMVIQARLWRRRYRGLPTGAAPLCPRFCPRPNSRPSRLRSIVPIRWACGITQSHGVSLTSACAVRKPRS